MKAYRAALIGCGGRGRPHLQAYEHLNEGRAVACCARVPERAENLAAQFGINAYADAAEMLTAEKPDIVHIATPPDARVELMTLVSDMRVPLCTVEKPIATGPRDWRQLLELEAGSATRFAVCHQFRWHPHFVKCQQALRSGKLGEVKFLDFSAGMNISGQGTHILNYGLSLNGDSPVARVFGAASGGSEMDSVHPAPDTTVGCLTFENGVRGLWNNGHTAPRVGDPTTDWQHVRAAAYADRGRVLWEEFGRWEVISPDGIESGTFGGMEAWMPDNLTAQAAFYRAMFDWLEGGAAPGTRLQQSLHEWQVVLALYMSAISREPIEIAEFDPPDDLFEQLAAVVA